ncbi:ProQ/FINO family protein [Aquicella lusitana]|uniref:ProP effector n=1 Tax=Aquicella lusitana TaxID=254246 RepID=A0A370G579_9COXI|nr:ProQ/FinO family protein [Aquicella lusitana]RDI38952.1 ProP effector [Aquicella lusitana]VVC74299.1 RNA chaperone ProQ [Aquicella lusitana]
MSRASLKEQLQAVASQLSDTLGKEQPATKRQLRQTVKPKKPKPKWLDYVQYGVELLKLYFPASFKSGGEVKPLKKGIKQDLVKRLSTLDSIVTEDKACMVKSLAYYVNTAAYHKSVVEGATRIDLDGNPAGAVSAEEAKYSIERHQAKLKAKQNAVSTASVAVMETTAE